ncbi:hypothetical protein GCM10010220_08240 [Streptomyces parvulus]|nr:hypothetical protein GCM10010220_08240 [Streptomyces parvulus]
MVLYIVTVPGMSLALLRRLGVRRLGMRSQEGNVHGGATIPAPPVTSHPYRYDNQSVPVDNRLGRLARPGSMAV